MIVEIISILEWVVHLCILLVIAWVLIPRPTDMHIHDIIRERLEAKAGCSNTPTVVMSLKELEQSEWSPRFERLMRHRLIMGALRYGRMHYRKPQYDRLAGIRKRLGQYIATGNTECLVDIANLALLEYEEGRHPSRHFKPQTESHVV